MYCLEELEFCEENALGHIEVMGPGTLAQGLSKPIIASSIVHLFSTKTRPVSHWARPIISLFKSGETVHSTQDLHVKSLGMSVTLSTIYYLICRFGKPGLLQ